jgi:hypothetical protein
MAVTKRWEMGQPVSLVEPKPQPSRPSATLAPLLAASAKREVRSAAKLATEARQRRSRATRLGPKNTRLKIAVFGVATRSDNFLYQNCINFVQKMVMAGSAAGTTAGG